jgi:carbon storage regulator
MKKGGFTNLRNRFSKNPPFNRFFNAYTFARTAYNQRKNQKESIMLVLSRKKDEQIILTIDGQDVMVKVLKIDGNKVRLGITAPDQVTVHREEVWKRQAEFAPADQMIAANI